MPVLVQLPAMRRTVHPHALHNGPSGWMLRGREVESDTVKEFVVRRMADDVAIGQPGSAEAPAWCPGSASTQ